MTVLILEGADATGKSSHAAWHEKHNGAKVIHAGPPRSRDWFAEYVEPIVHHVTHNPDQMLVLDRWHLGEVIWPRLFDRPSLFDEPGSFALCNKMLGNVLDLKVKIVARSDDAIINTLMLRGEQDQIETVLKSQQLFMDLACSCRDIDVEIVMSDDLEREVTCINA